MELTQAVEMEQSLADGSLLLESLFGTPDHPRWPEFLSDPDSHDADRPALVSMERLQRAAGPVSSNEEGVHRGLYREHCVVCHGLSGDGLGPSAALLNPYPRDFRLGKVKFKSTPVGQKPTRNDLRRTLHAGIVGTSMPSFSLLEEEDIESLIDYVVYLSVRGEVERRLLTMAAVELDIERGERLYDPTMQAADSSGRDDGWEDVRREVKRVVRSWQDAEQHVIEVPDPPPDLPILGQHRGIDGGDASLAASIKRGRDLFRGNVAACAFCHGTDAKGDGQQNNYDDWTRDWTSQAGLNPKDKTALKPMLELGALNPRNILPRNLQRGVFRGGGDPEDLYQRIVGGIEGTPMPAVPRIPENPQGVTERQIWDLVNYLLSLGVDQSYGAPVPPVGGSHG